MAARLSLTFQHFDGWNCDCRVDIGCNRFTAKAAFPGLDVSEFAAFAAELRAYPLTQEVAGCWYGGKLVLSVRQVSDLGKLSVSVFVGHYHRQDNTYVELETDYASLQVFADQLSAVIAKGSGIAELRYEPSGE